MCFKNKKSVLIEARQIMNYLTDEEACAYLDANYGDDKREEIVRAIWREYGKLSHVGGSNGRQAKNNVYN